MTGQVAVPKWTALLFKQHLCQICACQNWYQLILHRIGKGRALIARSGSSQTLERFPESLPYFTLPWRFQQGDKIYRSLTSVQQCDPAARSIKCSHRLLAPTDAQVQEWSGVAMLKMQIAKHQP